MTIYIKDSSDLHKTIITSNENENILIICFTASWCNPCQKIMSPLLETICKMHKSIKAVKVDVDDCEELASENNITSMPTLLFYKKNKLLERLEGTDEDKFFEIVDKLITQ